MPAKKWLMVFINIFGGMAVLGSYVYGALTHPGAGQILWGDVPHSIRTFSTAGMFLAAAGYFAFTSLILFRLNPTDARVANRFGFGVWRNRLVSCLFLIPSLCENASFLDPQQPNGAVPQDFALGSQRSGILRPVA